MTLTPEQKAVIRQCSRDEDTYQQLLKLFETALQTVTPADHAQLLRTVIDTIPDRVYVKDQQSRFMLANRAMWTHHQMPDEQTMIGKTDFDLRGERGRPLFDAEQEMFKTGEPIFAREIHGFDPDDPAYTLVHKFPMYDERGEIIGLIGISHDISEKKRLEEELREKQAFLEQIVRAVPDVVYVYDIIDQVNVYSNQQGYNLLGLTPEEVDALGSRFLESVMHPDDWLRYLDHTKGYATAQDGDILEFEYRLKHADRTWRWIVARELIFKRNPDGSPRQVLGVAHDISRRRRSEIAVSQSEAQTVALINAIPDLIFELNAAGVILNFKPRARMELEFPQVLYIGQTLHQIYPKSLADQLLMMVGRTLATRQLQVWEYQSPFGGESSLREARFVAIDHERVMVISRDITEIRRVENSLIERERLQIALQKEQELSLLKSRMMTRISHEFRTPLSVIMTSSELLWHYGQRMTKEQRHDHFQRVLDEIQNMSEILKNIAFIVQPPPKQQDLALELCDLKTICHDLIEEMKHGEGSQHHWEMDIEKAVRPFHADASVLYKMTNHLLLNAIRYSPTKTKIRVELQQRRLHLTLRVIDQGMGIPDDDLPRVFEPFFRGSNVGDVSGMGLGLSVVEHAVELHEGTIKVDSVVGEGTTATIQLPTST
jgi:PAS domain S-box-containing protein